MTPEPATCLAVPATNPVKPARAELDSPSTAIGALTDCDVIFTILPQPDDIILGSTDCISEIGVNIFASIALIKSSRSQSDHKPGGGPPALVTKISGASHAFNILVRPSVVVTSPGTQITFDEESSLIALPAFSRSSSDLEFITTFTPSIASALAQPNPKPFEEAQTIAHFPFIPRSIFLPSLHFIKIIQC